MCRHRARPFVFRTIPITRITFRHVAGRPFSKQSPAFFARPATRFAAAARAHKALMRNAPSSVVQSCS